MAIVNWDGEVKFYGTDKKAIQLCKTIEGYQCGSCRKRFNRGSYCMGKGYERFCLNCAEKLLDNFDTALIDMKELNILKS